ncbi:MAG: hypothetical protein LQ340_000009 [Diploschistes diacapsis]|nr:MAG: hypothetical protein LQ340_000009 [Diploschistes diacapsis]
MKFFLCAGYITIPAAAGYLVSRDPFDEGDLYVRETDFPRSLYNSLWARSRLCDPEELWERDLDLSDLHIRTDPPTRQVMQLTHQGSGGPSQPPTPHHDSSPTRQDSGGSFHSASSMVDNGWHLVDKPTGRGRTWSQNGGPEGDKRQSRLKAAKEQVKMGAKIIGAAPTTMTTAGQTAGGLITSAGILANSHPAIVGGTALSALSGVAANVYTAKKAMDKFNHPGVKDKGGKKNKKKGKRALDEYTDIWLQGRSLGLEQRDLDTLLMARAIQLSLAQQLPRARASRMIEARWADPEPEAWFDTDFEI